MQDWPLEIVDTSHLTEFCDVYESDLISRMLKEKENFTEIVCEVKFALMALIVACLDESPELEEWLDDEKIEDSQNESLTEKVSRLLREDFLLHLNTIDYWRMPEERWNLPYIGEFPVSSLCRSIWDECYKSEYSKWLVKQEI